MEINYLVVITAVVASFILSAAWYIIFNTRLAKLNPKIYGNPGKSQSLPMIAVELGRNIVLSFVLLYLLTQIKTESLVDAIVLALVLWVGFPFTLLAGSVFHEKVPWKLALIHSGDWLIKIILIILILSTWK